MLMPAKLALYALLLVIACGGGGGGARVGVAAAAADESEAGTCPATAQGYEQNTDFKGFDLRPGLENMTTPMECCALCAATTGCTAISFGPVPRQAA